MEILSKVNALKTGLVTSVVVASASASAADGDNAITTAIDAAFTAANSNVTTVVVGLIALTAIVVGVGLLTGMMKR